MESIGDIATVTVHIKKIREKIEQSVDNSFPVKITLVRERRYTEFSGGAG